MKRFSALLLVVAFLVLWLSPAGVLAQKSDSDGDGVPDSVDRCPRVPGPASNNGCPVSTNNNGNGTTPSQPLHPPGDSDGDGTLEGNDKCPLEGGPDWNNGCPTNLKVPPQPTPQIVLPTLPTSGPCVIATMSQGRVNLRAMPSTTAAIIGVLNPMDFYPAFATFTDANKSIWYLVKTGWSSAQAVRIGGSCAGLPAFDFGDVKLKFIDGPGNGLTLNFIPVSGGKPFVNLHPFGSDKISLNFTKLAGDFPNEGFSFLLEPFPGMPGSGPAPSNPQSPKSDVFSDGYLLSQMGDGSVFLAMPPTSQGGDNPLQGILIGLSKSGIDLNHVLDGMLLPAVQTGGSKTYGILIGLLLPAVQTGGSKTYGILIGLLLPAVHTGDLNPPSDKIGFSLGGDKSSGGGGGTGKLSKSLQEMLDMGLNFFVPAVGATGQQFDSPGWGVDIQGIIMPTE